MRGPPHYLGAALLPGQGRTYRSIAILFAEEVPSG